MFYKLVERKTHAKLTGQENLGVLNVDMCDGELDLEET